MNVKNFAMDRVGGKTTVSSVEVVKILFQTVQQFSTLMDAGVFFAVESDLGARFIYSKGLMKEQYDAGNLKPSVRDINLSEGPTPSSSADRLSAFSRRKEDLRAKIAEGRESRDTNEARSSGSRESEAAPPPLMRDYVLKRKRDAPPPATDDAAGSIKRRKPSVSPALSNANCRLLCVRRLPAEIADAAVRADLEKVYSSFSVDSIRVEGEGSKRFAIVEFPFSAQAMKAYRSHLLLFNSFSKYAKVEVAFYRKIPDQARKTLLLSNAASVPAPTLRERLSHYGDVVDLSAPTIEDLAHDTLQVEYATISQAAKALRKYRQHFPSSTVGLSYAKAVPSNCVWIGGLPDSINNAEIEAFCRLFGNVVDVFINRSPNNALVYFDSEEEACRAERALRNSTSLGGNYLEVDFAGRDFQNKFLDANSGSCGDGGGGSSSDAAANVQLKKQPQKKTAEDYMSDVSGENFSESEEGDGGRCSNNLGGIEISDTSTETLDFGTSSRDPGPLVVNGSVSVKKEKDVVTEKSVEEGTRSHPSTIESSAEKVEKHVVFVGNLDKTINENELRRHFSPFGPVVGVKIKYRGGEDACAFVEFARRNSLVEAVDKMQGTLIGTREIILCED